MNPVQHHQPVRIATADFLLTLAIIQPDRLLIFNLCVTLNQFFLNAFTSRIWFISSKGTLVNKEDTS